MLTVNLLPGAVRGPTRRNHLSLISPQALAYLPIFKSDQPQMPLSVFFLIMALLGLFLGWLAFEVQHGLSH